MRRFCPSERLRLLPVCAGAPGAIERTRLMRAFASGLLLCLATISGCDEIPPQQRIERAQTFLQQGDRQGAIAELKRVLQEQPDAADVRLMLGKLYLASGRLPYAEKELDRAAALGLESPELMITLGELWLRQRRYQRLLDGLRARPAWPDDAQVAVHRLRARAYLGVDAAEAARNAYEAILRIDPDNVDARIGLVRMALRADDAHASELILTDALRIAPDHPTLLGLRGDIAFQLGQYAEAVAAYRSQLQVAPESAAAQLALAQALIATGARARADLLLDQFLAERPGNGLAHYLRATAAFQAGDAEGTQLHSERALAAMPDHVPSLFLAGASNFSLGRWEAAYWSLQKALVREPDHAPAQRLLAATNRQLALQRPAEVDAVAEGERLFRVDLAAVSGAWSGAGAAGPAEAAQAGQLARAGDHAEAAQILARLAGAPPEGASVLELRGGLALLAGRPQRAARAFEAALHQEPAAILARKLALAQWQAGAHAKSRVTLEAWLARAPEDWATRLVLADLHLGAGQPAAARRQLRTVVTARPNDVAALNNLAWALLQEGQPRAARTFAERALSLAPHEPQVMDTFALVLVELGELDRAVDLLQQAVRAENRGPEIEIHLAQTLAKRGDQEDAIDILRRLLSGPHALADRDQAQAEALLHDLGG